MNIYKRIFSYKYNINKISQSLFFIGLILLASAPFFASIILLLAAIFSSINPKISFFKDKYNLVFFISGVLMLLSTIIHNGNYIFGSQITNKLTYAGIFNWLPFFWIFWTFEKFLSSCRKRTLAFKCFLLGSIPVFFSGLSQYFLKWYGPFSFMNNLIIWFQRPLESDEGITGLFNNPNYMGCWLVLVFPFSLYFLINCKKYYQKILMFLTTFIILTLGILTLSRSNWAGMILSIPILFGVKTLVWFLPIVICLLIPIFLTSIVFLPLEISLFFREIIPKNIWLQFNELGFKNLESSRIEMWNNSIRLIFKKPFFGWGGGSFPDIFKEEFNTWLGHPHNLFIELSFSYGLICSILIFGTIGFLFVKSFKVQSNKFFIKSLKNKPQYYSNQAWITSTILLFLTQMVDVQYFDIRISLSFWILITGLKCIVKEDKLKLNN